MADFMKLLQQAQEMQGRIQKMQEELEAVSVSGSAGGGLVTVEANGKGTVTRVKIDPSVVKAEDVEMLEDLVLVAVSDAQKKAQALASDEMKSMAAGLGLPGMPGGFKLPF